MDDLQALAKLIAQRNHIAADITGVIGRPALTGHVGEFIAARIFDIALEESASHKGSDGRFVGGPLDGATVNVKWYAQRENVLDINPDGIPDYYLVLAGPKTSAGTSRGESRPWTIAAVYLFEAGLLIEELAARGVQLNVATSVREQQWTDAEIYPRPSERLPLTDEQRAMLGLFSAEQVT